MLETAAKLAADTFAESLETMAFICPLPPEGPVNAPEDPVLVRIAFADRTFRALELVAGRSLGLLLAANLLGMTDDDPMANERGADALKETMNIACGALLQKLTADGASPVEMGIPIVLPFEPSDWNSFVASPTATILDADGCIIAVRIGGCA